MGAVTKGSTARQRASTQVQVVRFQITVPHGVKQMPRRLHLPPGRRGNADLAGCGRAWACMLVTS